jgi:pyrroloquinoline quinone biosynthesis protein E
MGGWGSRTIVVAPDGAALPCHSARSLPGLQFENAAQRPLREIWRDSAAFNAFRGTAWLRDPCRTCDRRELDYGGCRCQAFALTGDATAADPACPLSPAHAIVAEAREQRGPAAAPAERRRGKSLPVYSA